MLNLVGQSCAKWPGPPQRWHVSGVCLAHWASMSMGMPGGSACCWKGHGGGHEGWAEVGAVTGAGCGVAFWKKALAVKPVMDVGIVA